MKHVFIILVTLGAASLYGKVVVSEIMRNPAGRESDSPGGLSHEYVEMFNTGRDTLSLDSLFLSDGMDADAVISFDETIPGCDSCQTGLRELRPGSCALILDKDYLSAITHDPQSAYAITGNPCIFTVTDGDLGNGLAGDDGVFLYKGTGDRIHRLVAVAADTGQDLSPEMGKCYLTERNDPPEGFGMVPRSVLFDLPGYEPADATPGRYPHDLDGWLLEWKAGPFDPHTGFAACTLAVCSPRGHLLDHISLDPFTILHSVPSEPESSVLTYYTSLPLTDATRYAITIQSDSGTRTASLDASSVWLPEGTLVVSEISPRATESSPEWFEIHNTGRVSILLDNWHMSDGEDHEPLAPPGINILPDERLVLTDDIRLFTERYGGHLRCSESPGHLSLNNYADSLMLIHPSGSTIDKTGYDHRRVGTWPDTYSLQRSHSLSPCNWTAARPTPGLPNHTIELTHSSKPHLTIGPIPFTPDKDGHDDVLSIRISAPSGSTAEIDVYGLSGQVLRSFSWNHTPIQWNGKTNQAKPAPVGPIVVVARISTPRKTVVLRKKGILWR